MDNARICERVSLLRIGLLFAEIDLARTASVSVIIAWNDTTLDCLMRVELADVCWFSALIAQSPTFQLFIFFVMIE
jgi:hypothetical protein